MDKIDDKWMRIGGVALLSLNLLILDTEGNRRPFFQQALYVSLYILSVFLILETGRSIILRLHKKYPQPGDGKRRFWKTSLFVTVSNQLLITTTFYISHIIRGIPFSRVNHSLNFFLAIFVVSLVLALVQSTLYERYYYFISLRKVEKENEELLRINLQSQFDSLKQQVNPHFLFNSINTVSSLIGKDPGKAVKFLTEMSKVYRYLLRANEEKLSSLQDELNFLDSYFHMLKTRYQTGLNLNIQVGKEFSGYFLPALTLQLLIENAVKHNIISKERPLNIEILTTDHGWLLIRNNLQKKKNLLPSARVGLANIMEKFRLLNQPEVIINENLEDFTVLIPLIKVNK